MSLSVSEANADIARLVADRPCDEALACARESRALAEYRQRMSDTEELLQRIERAAGRYRTGLRLSPADLRLLAVELRRLKGDHR